MERGAERDVLDRALDRVQHRSSGQMVLMYGEAGVGKSALLRSFGAAQQGSHRVLTGRCDALFTPRPLGPFLDVVQQVGGDLELLATGQARPHDVATALLGELRRAPSVLALEDMHWADGASLDVLSLIARRLEGVPVLAVITYRDDELPITHPLRIVVGELATIEAVSRLKLAPLSADGVATLVGSSGLDSEDLYRRTGGNPFFVTEVVASGTSEIPLTVREAVLARVARLSPGARALVDAVAVFPPGCEYRLLEAVVGSESDHLDECLSSGVLVAGPTTVGFRHELARLAVEAALPPTRRMGLHERALDALTAMGCPDGARLVHHAEAARDEQSVIRLAPDAARRAAALGAHREAAEHYASALRVAPHVAPHLLGELHDRRAYACYVSGDFPAALEAQRSALEHHRSVNDRLRQGHAARRLSLLLRYQGDLTAAWANGHEAVDVLEALPVSHELAMAYCNLSHLANSAEDEPDTHRWAARALAVADGLGDVEAEVYIALNVGSLELMRDDPAGVERVQRALRVALDNGFDEHAGRAYVALVFWSPRGRRYAAADRHLAAGLRFCDERGMDLWRAYLLAYRARSELDRGRWDDAVGTATLILDDPRNSPVPRVIALAVVGLIRARRGQPGVWEPLDEAWALARETGELQRIEPVVAARAEAFWLEGRHRELLEEVAFALDLASARGASWVIGEMTSWQSRSGVIPGPHSVAPEPFASELAGDWMRACDGWTALDAPYEAALANAHSDDEARVRNALETLLGLGARPAAAIVTRRLRQRGARGLPRGPRETTRTNPAGLTSRELEVLALVAAGLQNHAIASRLVLSQRTIDHHVSALLQKLGVRTRADAATVAARLGLLAQKR